MKKATAISLDNNFYIYIEINNYVLKEKKTYQTGKNKGQEYFVIKGYCPTLESALDLYFGCMTKNSIGKLGNEISVEELKITLKDIKKNAEKLAITLNKELEGRQDGR